MMQSLTPKYCVPHRKAWCGTGLLEDVRGTVQQLGKRILFSASQTHPGPVVNTLIQLIHYVCCSIPKLFVVSCLKLPFFVGYPTQTWPENPHLDHGFPLKAGRSSEVPLPALHLPSEAPRAAHPDSFHRRRRKTHRGGKRWSDTVPGWFQRTEKSKASRCSFAQGQDLAMKLGDVIWCNPEMMLGCLMLIDKYRVTVASLMATKTT